MTSARIMRLLVVFLLSSSLVVSIANLSAPTGAGGARVMAVTSGSLSTIGPSHAPPGYGITGPSMGVTMTGSGFISPSTCGLFATGGSGALFNTNPNFTSCVVSSQGALLATFAVNTTARPGGYTVNIIDDLSGHHFNSPLTIGFTVDAIPTISFSVNSGSPGAFLTVTGSGFAGGISSNPDQGACSISAHLNGAPAPIISSTSCFIDSTGHLYSTQFTIANAASPGGYLITVNGTHGDFGQKGFTVTTFSVSLNPTSGHPGQVVFVSGNSAPPNTACRLQSNNPNLITSVSGLAGTINGVISGSFTVGSNAAGRAGGGADNVTLICGSSTAFATFTVTPIITLNPTASAGNQTVTLSGVGFRADVTGCAITTSDPSSPDVVTIPSCSLTGTGSVSGHFKVSPTVTNGIYNITVWGLLPSGNTTGLSSPLIWNFAYALFQKVSSPFISVSPTETAPGYGTLDGTPITISGGGFPTGSSRSCTLSSTGASVLFASSPGVSCTISPSGTVTASFAVAATATPNPTQALNLNYTVRVTDTVSQPFPPTFPFAETFFSVKPMPTILPTPILAAAGSTVSIAITAPTVVFQPTFDAGTCTISSTPTNIISTPNCFIDSGGFLSSSTSFVVASNAGSGGYTITVTGVHGDFGTTSFTLTTTSPLTINPNTGSPPLGSLPGTTVRITGTGYSLSDTSCIITQEPNGTNVPYFISALTCSVSGGSLSATFVVAAGATNNTAPTPYTLKVKGTPAYDFKAVDFTVVPRIALTPNSGSGGTQVSVIGSGFKGGFGVAACAAAPTFGFLSGTFISVPNPAPNPLFDKLNQCTRFNDGTISGSFNVSLTASQGAYLVIANATGGDAASAPFAVGARLLTVTPDTAGALTFVSVTGTGFVQGDTTCTLTVIGTPAVVKTGTGQCAITNGNVQASFQVDTLANPGTYNVQVTGSPNLDIGVGVFTVATTTLTTTTFTSYTSSSTTLTTLSTTTTTTQVSTSLTTTTYQTTGVSTETSRTFTTTTILAPTTTTFTTIFTVTTLFGTAVTTVVGTITKTLGQVIRSAETSYSDGLALLAVLILLSTWVLRRLLD